MSDIFTQLFGSEYSAGLRPEDHDKGQALLAVVCKSTASLGDVMKLANALGLQLKLTAVSAPKEEPNVEQG